MPDSNSPKKAAPSQSQPAIARKLIVRTLILLVILGTLFGGYQWAQQQKGDFDLAPAVTADMVAAVQYLPEGQRAVVVKADGSMVENAGYNPGDIDRDLAWKPDGNRLFFVSDRGTDALKKVKSFNIYRWNPVTNAAPVQRTVGTRGRSNPAFPDEPGEDQNQSALITSSGFVLEFDAKEQSTRQVLPPLTRSATVTNAEEGSASTSQFSGAYGSLGNSFRIAKWSRNKRFIFAVMRRDEGEIFIIQDLQDKDGIFPPPQPIAAGDRIDFAISPKDGRAFYTVSGFQWPDPAKAPKEYRKGNVVTVPYRHAVGIIDPEKGPEGPVGISTNDGLAFSAPKISPDGSEIALILGNYKDGALEGKQLMLTPAKPAGGQASALLVPGEVFEPAWHPNGKSLVYIKRNKAGKRAIFSINKDGTNEKDLTGDKGDFGFPMFSPQSK